MSLAQHKLGLHLQEGQAKHFLRILQGKEKKQPEAGASALFETSSHSGLLGL